MRNLLQCSFDDEAENKYRCNQHSKGLQQTPPITWYLSFLALIFSFNATVIDRIVFLVEKCGTLIGMLIELGWGYASTLCEGIRARRVDGQCGGTRS